ncbi:hypothetical protein P8C59_007930 [Phyllachora maydis]|uniref:Structural maintenance of chromosomes protein n=1 Tax=Phyllachora maydis TaxID=1825666 RepID=A0AAD9MEP3_9PEZI|nr:hypothetical protein P8C59_007930 [Phyllachora maydis]
MGKLIRLELFNFKSYKGHHTLLFGDSYFTSIIGPNGSGKSNCMDAISFVLGIKSAKLRSSQLRDLVYRGRVMKTSKIQDDGTAAPIANGHSNGHENGGEAESSQRASRNDPKTAWVMAVYEDDAGDEQKWKRSITTQGSSEYRINDRVVSAQQYNEALESENILIKARNFLVFQGDVEAIAAQSPHDLTKLIEQISGSLEYKEEYEKLQAAAEQAAEDQSHKLHLRRGINSEIKHYQEQKREAENFEKKTAERDEAVVTHILWKLFHFQKVMDESSAKIQEHQENLKEFRRGLTASQEKLETARREQSDIARKVGKIERSKTAKVAGKDEKDNSLVPISEKIDTTKRNLDKLCERVIAVRKERDKFAEEIKKTRKDMDTVEKARLQFEKEWSETIKKQGKDLTEADFKEAGILRKEVKQKTVQNEQVLADLRRQLKKDEVTVSTFKDKIASFESAKENHDSQIAAIQARLAKAKENEVQLNGELERKQKMYHALHSEQTRIRNAREELREKQVRALKALGEAEESLGQRRKDKVLKELVTEFKKMFVGVRGRVGDLCKPKMKKYEEAVATALGGHYDSIIVETNAVALDCIEYLKEKHISPKIFIPLDHIKVDSPNSAIKGISGARLTIETIDYDPAIERAILYACENSVVTDTLDIAKDIVYGQKIQVKAVTLEGHVINKTGTMTMGRLKEPKRKFQMDNTDGLKAELAKLDESMRKLPDASQRDVEGSELQREIEKLKQDLAWSRNEQGDLQRNLSSKQRELEDAERQLDEYEPKLEEQEAELQKTRTQVSKFENAILEVEEKVFAGFCKRLGYANYRAYDAQQGTLNQQALDQRQRFDVQKSKLEANLTWSSTQLKGSEKRLQNLEQEARRHEEEVEHYEQERSTIEEELAQIEAGIEALDEKLNDLREVQAEKAAKVLEAKQDMQKRRKEIETREREIQLLEAEIKNYYSQKFSLLRRCKLEQLQIPLAEGSLEDIPNENVLLEQDGDAMDVDGEDGQGLLDAVLDDYGIEIDFDKLDDDLKQRDGDEIEKQLDERIGSLNAELEKLNPNMRAMERLENVKARLEATEQEYEDSRAQLRAAKEAFEKIKKKRFDLFDKAFSHIAEQIVHVYRDLTRSDAYPLGGQAYLDKEENDTPYLHGVKYHAMPPLKRFRDMELLSGGEKTMAALALLFAIHSYQPSPFFVLDEVDAALDNANVDKIKKYIREHAGPGMQFIVISLKTGLFQDSESLVGVYRDQDVNSSKTLTLDLRKYV